MLAQNLSALFLRIALAAGFFSAVADRWGLWGRHGEPAVAWGDMPHFLSYAAQLNPWFPAAVISAIGWIVTFAELIAGILLLLGWQTRWAAWSAAALLLSFGIGMTAGTGIKSALDASVFAASAGAALLATMPRYAWSLDAVRARRTPNP